MFLPTLFLLFFVGANASHEASPPGPCIEDKVGPVSAQDTGFSTTSSGTSSDPNPTFRDLQTGLLFTKFATSIGNASEAELNTMEYLGSYDFDVNGDMWLVSEAEIGVARLTKDYQQRFSGDLDQISTNRTYDSNATYFSELLSSIRQMPDMQAEAQAWVAETKALNHAIEDNIDPVSGTDPGNPPPATPPPPPQPRLLEKKAGNCGPARCQTARNCIAKSGRYCRTCTVFACYRTQGPLPLPIVDAC